VDGDGIDGGPYGQDCNDNDAEVYPDATEDCEDGVDGDCDGIGDAYDDDCIAADDDDDDSGDCACRAEGSAPPAGGLAWLALALLAVGRRLHRLGIGPSSRR
jgi:MYXO-CTERM domain-containing protein